MAWRLENVSNVCKFLCYSGELGHNNKKKCVEFAHGMGMELEYVQLIILLYILAKQKMTTSHEEAKVRKHVAHFLGEK